MTKTLLSIGECMVEMAQTGDGTYRQGFAGDTFNMAWHARRALDAGWDVQYFTAVGDDDFSSRMLAFMAQQGIGTRHVARLGQQAPGLYMISLNKGERSFTYWRDASAARRLADDQAQLEKATNAADAIFYSGITLAILPAAARQSFLRVMAWAKAEGKTVAFDSNIRQRLWASTSDLRQAIADAAQTATLALPTGEDEYQLFGDGDAEAAAGRYRQWGVGEVVVKCGPEPAIISYGESIHRIGPAAKVVPVDTTGAGDSFNGAYIAARLGGSSPEASVRMAHANAARVIQAYGALV